MANKKRPVKKKPRPRSPGPRGSINVRDANKEMARTRKATKNAIPDMATAAGLVGSAATGGISGPVMRGAVAASGMSGPVAKRAKKKKKRK